MYKKIFKEILKDMLMILEEANAATGGMGIVGIIIYVLFFIAIIYFFMVKPQKKQQAQHDELTSKMKPGDSIMTSSGFYGTIVAIDEDTVIVEFGNNKNCRIPMHKKAIVEVESAEAAYAAEEETEAEDEEDSKKKNKLGKKKK